MSLLFFLSGAALFFACRKISRVELLNLRLRRLFLPLVFGMAVVVPPQVYLELLATGELNPDYFAFYSLYLDPTTSAFPEHQHGPLGLWTWNHLWFLSYLWVYTFVFVALKPGLDRVAGYLATRRLAVSMIVGLPVALLVLSRYTLLPT